MKYVMNLLDGTLREFKTVSKSDLKCEDLRIIYLSDEEKRELEEAHIDLMKSNEKYYHLGWAKNV